MDGMQNRVEADAISVPVKLLAEFGRSYPDCWRKVDEIRANRRSSWPYEWPNDVFFPASGAYIFDTPEESCLVSCLSAWRTGKGVYTFDPTVLAELMDTPVAGNIPVEVLRKLPEWCVYVVYPKELWDEQVHGFFAFLTMAATPRGEDQLCLVFVALLNLTGPVESSIRYVGIPLLEGKTLEQCCEQYALDGKALNPKFKEVNYRTAVSAVSPMLSILLYLCSTNAEILGRDGELKPIGRPPIKYTKRGPRIFGPDQPRVWEVAYRIGAAIRAAGPGISGPDRHGSHASPRPHIRRAHWHAFWIGEKAKPGIATPTKRELILHWLPPIPVKVTPDSSSVPTVHKVVESCR